MNLFVKYEEVLINLSLEDLINIFNDSIFLKYLRLFRKDLLILKLLVKGIVKSLYFYLYMMIILLDYEINFNLYFIYNLCKKFLIDIFVIFFFLFGIWVYLNYLFFCFFDLNRIF